MLIISPVAASIELTRLPKSPLGRNPCAGNRFQSRTIRRCYSAIGQDLVRQSVAVYPWCAAHQLAFYLSGHAQKQGTTLWISAAFRPAFPSRHSLSKSDQKLSNRHACRPVIVRASIIVVSKRLSAPLSQASCPGTSTIASLGSQNPSVLQCLPSVNDALSQPLAAPVNRPSTRLRYQPRYTLCTCQQ